MIIVNTEQVASHRIEKTLGLVRGNTIRARHVGRDIIAGFKAIFGGEIGDYTKLLAESREQALDRMCQEAAELGANAVVNVRFSTSAVMQGASELMAYGTAVKLSDDHQQPTS